jgi:anti-anti-sigma regulatory factor
MLRITERNLPDGGTLLELHGSLTGPWVLELRNAVERRRILGTRPALDLAGVTFAGSPGVQLLVSLRNGGVPLRRPSPFVRRLLEEEGP